MRDRSNATAIALHWLIAVPLLGRFAFGLMLNGISRGAPARGLYVNRHKSSGLVIGLLILARVIRRLAQTPRRRLASMPAWERLAARRCHATLYLCILMLPLSGHLASKFLIRHQVVQPRPHTVPGPR
jgi:cytochrome b561